MLQEIYINYILKYYKWLIVMAIIIVSSLGFFLINSYGSDETLKEVPTLKDIVIDEDDEKEDDVADDYYYVDIKGSIKNPGVYKILKGQRVIDVVTLAGGLINQADTSVLNLSKKVVDEMIIVIYSKDEIKRFKEDAQTIEETIVYIEKECDCPDPNINGACIDKSDSEGKVSSSKVSINTGSKEELMTLPSVGEAKAQSIINYRNDNGLFTSIEGILNVSGIGESVFDKIKDYIII